MSKTKNHYRPKPIVRTRIISTLTASGAEKVDSKPLAADLVGFRPMTMEEQYNRFTAHGLNDLRMVPLDYDEFTSEDDFHDDIDDDVNPLSPYEMTDRQKDLAKLGPSKLRQLANSLRNPKKPVEASKINVEQPTDAPATTLNLTSETPLKG